MKFLLNKTTNFIFISIIILIIISIIIPTQSKKARCYLIPEKNSGISGELNFIQEKNNSSVYISGKIFAAKIGNYTLKIQEYLTSEKINEKERIHKTSDPIKRLTQNDGKYIYSNVVYSNGILIKVNITTNELNLFDYEEKFHNLLTYCELYNTNNNTNIILASGNMQNHYPIYSLIFGFSFIIIGLSITTFHFIYFNKKRLIKEGNFSPSDVRNI
jgi:lipopolysaccharide export LptBFGC system permease protein LptF